MKEKKKKMLEIYTSMLYFAIFLLCACHLPNVFLLASTSKSVEKFLIKHCVRLYDVCSLCATFLDELLWNVRGKRKATTKKEKAFQLLHSPHNDIEWLWTQNVTVCFSFFSPLFRFIPFLFCLYSESYSNWSRINAWSQY